MPKYIRTDKQLLVAAFGITTSLITGITLGWIEVDSGFAIYSLMVWFVIPIGAFFSGFLAASGYFAGARLFHQKPAGGVLFNMIGASISAFLIIHYIPYFMLEVDGVRIKETVSFWQYLDIDIKNTSLTFMRSVSTGELGNFWGYVYTIIQLLAFSFGAIAVFGWLSQSPYCENCSRYLKKTGIQLRYTRNIEKLNMQIKHYEALLSARKYEDSFRYQAEDMGVEYQGIEYHGDLDLKSKIITRRCSGCGINQHEFIASQRNNDKWENIYENKIRFFTEKQCRNEDETNKVVINCPKCEQHLRVLSGKSLKVACPSCRHDFEYPFK